MIAVISQDRSGSVCYDVNLMWKVSYENVTRFLKRPLAILKMNLNRTILICFVEFSNVYKL